MPATNEKLVKKITEALDGLSASMIDAAAISATATTESTAQLKTALLLLSLGGGTSISAPPSGGFKISNIYISADGKLAIEYDDTPVP
jgi:hypothetical protein